MFTTLPIAATNSRPTAARRTHSAGFTSLTSRSRIGVAVILIRLVLPDSDSMIRVTSWLGMEVFARPVASLAACSAVTPRLSRAIAGWMRIDHSFDPAWYACWTLYGVQRRVLRDGNQNPAGMTPTIVRVLLPKAMVLPTMFGSPPKRSRQKP